MDRSGRIRARSASRIPFRHDDRARAAHPAGIEENLWDVKKGVRASTVQMIEKQVEMARTLNRPIATAEQAREMLKIGVSYSSTEETLKNLGLPPNREPGNMGFQVLETDGRLRPAAQGGCGHIHAGEWEEEVMMPGSKKVAV